MKESFAYSQKETLKTKSLERIVRGSVLAFTAGLAACQTTGGIEHAYTGHASVETSKPGDPQEKGVLSPEAVRNMLRNDTRERVFVSTRGGVLQEVNDGRQYAESAGVPFFELETLIQNGETEPVFSHTHPLSAYTNVGYSEDDIQKVREGLMAVSPMPPSTADARAALALDDHFDPLDVEIINRAYDATGVWEYYVESDNDGVSIFHEADKRLYDRFVNSINTIEGESAAQHIEGIHPQKILSVLEANPETEAFSRKMNGVLDDFLTTLSPKESEVYIALGTLDIIGGQITASGKNGDSPEQVQEYINEYLKTAIQIGIHVTYTPHK